MKNKIIDERGKPIEEETGIQTVISGLGVQARETTKRSVTATAYLSLMNRSPSPESVGSYRKTTAKQYRTCWVDFAAFLKYRLGYEGDLADVWLAKKIPADTPAQLLFLDQHLSEIDAADIDAYKVAMQQRPQKRKRGRKKKVGLSASTINVRLAAIRYLFKISVRMKQRSDNPANPEMVDRGRVSSQSPVHSLTKDELIDLNEYLTSKPKTKIGRRNRVLILLLLYTGIRRAEAQNLHADDFNDFPDGGLSFIIMRKGRIRQEILLPTQLTDTVRSYLTHHCADGQPLFPRMSRPTGETTEPIAADQITRLVRNITKKVVGKARHPHVLRHTFITETLEGGAKLQDVQRFVGHRSPTTTVRYAENRLSRSTSAAEFFPKVKKKSVNGE